MDGNDQGDDFDDFFDTARPQSTDPSDREPRKDRVSKRNSPDSSLTRSASQKQDRSGSGSVDRRSLSSESRSSRDSSSDTRTDSDSASRNSRRRKSRSRSASSRSAGSNSSQDSRSYRRRDRSDSDTASSDRSRSRSSSPEVHRRAHRGNQKDRKLKDRRRDSSPSITPSTQSEDETSGRRSPTPPSRQAWATDSGDRGARRRPQERPKTAKRRTANNGEDGRTRHAERRGRSPNESDSDMTDVSPILSPRNGSVNGHKRGLASSGAKYSGSKPKFAAMPLEHADEDGDLLDAGDSNALDLNILMKAVSELEKQKRMKANTRRVMFEPTRPRQMEKSNYTFSNDDTNRIEAENQRLLREIVRQMHTSEKRQAVRVPDRRVQQSTLTAAAVNRRRDQKRIESENMVSVTTEPVLSKCSC